MDNPFAAYPLGIIILDYILGMIMWTLVGRFGMNLFLPIDSKFFFMRAFVKLTNPILHLFKPVTPSFLMDPLIPLFIAWFFFMIRFYLLPFLLGYSVMGMLSFPLESEFAAGLYELFG